MAFIVDNRVRICYTEYNIPCKKREGTYMTKLYGNAVVGQSGGPTAAINATLAGVIRGVLEIKTTTIMRAGQRDEWRDKIPATYFAQVLHYMMVCELDFAIVKAQIKTEIGDDMFLTTKHYKIERSEVELDIEFLIGAETAFAEQIARDQRPPLILPEI